jgi:type II secretory pathway pseudopilin PulG
MLYDFKKIITSSINKYKLNKSRRMASQQQQQYQQQHQQHQHQHQHQHQQQQQPSYGNGNQNPHNQQVSMASMDGTRSYVTARTAATQSLAGTANNDNATVGTNGGGGGGSITGGGGSVMGNTMAQPTPAKYPSFYTACGCIECYKPSRENLKYDYTYDDVVGENGSNKNKPAQAYPRIRERGEFYIDSFNGEPWSCSFGTAEKVSKKKTIN